MPPRAQLERQAQENDPPVLGQGPQHGDHILCIVHAEEHLGYACTHVLVDNLGQQNASPGTWTSVYACTDVLFNCLGQQNASPGT